MFFNAIMILPAAGALQQQTCQARCDNLRFPLSRSFRYTGDGFMNFFSPHPLGMSLGMSLSDL